MAKAPKAAAASKDEPLHISPLAHSHCTYYITGTRPLFCNAMANKARHTLLLPNSGRRKTTAERAVSLKHYPIEEFRNSIHRAYGESPPTRVLLPSTAFKKACGTAALDLPGTRKTEIGRLVWVNDATVDVYGVPQLSMTVVRTADMAKTPDIRTRAVLPRWACRITISFVKPKLDATALLALLATAGIVCGVGDNRQEKGNDSYGQFIVHAHNPTKEWLSIVESGGCKEQDAALANPEFFDPGSEELFSWFDAEIVNLRSGGGAISAEPEPEPEPALEELLG